MANSSTVENVILLRDWPSSHYLAVRFSNPLAGCIWNGLIFIEWPLHPVDAFLGVGRSLGLEKRKHDIMNEAEKARAGSALVG
jgi:hypothetical protein